MEVIQGELASQKTLRDYCCSRCWGPLNRTHAPGGQYKVLCARYPEEHADAGFVTKRFAERRRSESVAEALDVKVLLRQARIISKRSAADVMKDLGL